MIPVNFSEVAAMSAIPPTSSVVWRRSWGSTEIRVSSIWIRSAESRLASSPTRRWAKKVIGSEIKRA